MTKAQEGGAARPRGLRLSLEPSQRPARRLRRYGREGTGASIGQVVMLSGTIVHAIATRYATAALEAPELAQ